MPAGAPPAPVGSEVEVVSTGGDGAAMEVAFDPGRGEPSALGDASAFLGGTGLGLVDFSLALRIASASLLGPKPQDEKTTIARTPAS